MIPASGEASDMPGDLAIQLAEMQQTDARRGGILTAWFRLNGPAVLHQTEHVAVLDRLRAFERLAQLNCSGYDAEGMRLIKMKPSARGNVPPSHWSLPRRARGQLM
ncbi:hypothetical protein [Bradyrhizobium sp. sGM-13]|uniref:hypothetical protein n=1 Tax=Bradyrhizobium sp. sGM-13 TaxID=2831781 RepID=UPI001BCCC51B|nr:hypothetical protein [Bradyrhizobium sp. sGM-13]